MRKLITAAVLSLPLLASAAPTNLVVNGDFEANVLANGRWSNFSSIAGWTRVASSSLGGGFEVRHNVEGAAYSGNNFIELDTTGNTTIEQLFNSLVAGQQYTLGFAYSPRPGQTKKGTNDIEVLWNGKVQQLLTGSGKSQHDWDVYYLPVYAQAGTNSLRFASVGPSDSLGGSLDAVSLRVPEPGALALAGLALLGVWSARRRQA